MQGLSVECRAVGTRKKDMMARIPWRQRIRSSVSRYERNLFKALR